MGAQNGAASVARTEAEVRALLYSTEADMLPSTEPPLPGGQVTRLRPFFCYYGGKWRAAPTRTTESNSHDTSTETKGK